MPALHLAAPSSVPMSCWLPPADMAVPVSAKQSGSSMSPLHCLALSPTRSGLSCSFGLFPFPQHLAEQGHHVQPCAVGSITPSHTSQACTRVAPCCTWVAAPSHVPTLPGTSPVPAAAPPPHSATKPHVSSHGCPCPGWELRQQEAAPVLLHPQLSPSGADSPQSTGPPTLTSPFCSMAAGGEVLRTWGTAAPTPLQTTERSWVMPQSCCPSGMSSRAGTYLAGGR